MKPRPYLYGMEIKNKNSENFVVSQMIMAGIKVGSSIKYMPGKIESVGSSSCRVYILSVGSYNVNKKYIY